VILSDESTLPQFIVIYRSYPLAARTLECHHFPNPKHHNFHLSVELLLAQLTVFILFLSTRLFSGGSQEFSGTATSGSKAHIKAKLPSWMRLSKMHPNAPLGHPEMQAV
jgi:hypothetical protein